jgi:hypothetical protein
MRAVVAVIALSAAAVPAGLLLAAPKDREPEILTRTGKWIVNYDRDACHLVGTFGEGNAQVAARFTRYEHDDRFDLSLYGKRFRSPDDRTDAKIGFGLGEVTTQAMYGTSGAYKMAIFSSLRLDGKQANPGLDPLPKITPEQEAEIKGITVRLPPKVPFRLEFLSLAKPFAQMRDCTANLVKSWGYDPAVQATLLRPITPLNSPAKWLDSSDYPADALRSGRNGIVQFRLDVDPEGKIAGCHVLARTNPDDFADITCRGVTKRAKLQPALDAQGKPVRSYHVQKVRWVIES